MKLRNAMDGMEGDYEPSYFFMKIDTAQKLDEKMDRHGQTFIHEYIHFIQDIFLPYCVRNNVNEVYRFVYVMDKTKKEPILRPFDDWSSQLLCIERQHKQTWGYSKPVKNALKITGYERDEYVIKETQARVFKYTALLGSDAKHPIGAKDMLEYIAHKIESKHWLTDQPDIPYRTMDMVFDDLRLGDIPEMCKIALVEFCLHNDNPVHHLFQIVKSIQNGSLGLHGVEQCFFHFDFLEYVLHRLLWGARGGFEETMHTKAERRLSTIKDYIDKKYPVEHFRDISDWFGDVITYVSDNLKGRFYFAELYFKSKEDFLVEIDKLMGAIGVPLVFNSLAEHVSLLPEKYNKDSFIQFYVSFKFNEFLTHSDQTCPVCSFCENSSPDLMTPDCEVDVMRKISDDNQCPFGQFLNNHQINIVR